MPLFFSPVHFVVVVDILIPYEWEIFLWIVNCIKVRYQSRWFDSLALYEFSHLLVWTIFFICRVFSHFTRYQLPICFWLIAHSKITKLSYFLSDIGQTFTDLFLSSFFFSSIKTILISGWISPLKFANYMHPSVSEMFLPYTYHLILSCLVWSDFPLNVLTADDLYS